MTMTVVFALIGLIVGGVLGEVGGAFGGAALGYAIGLHLSFRRRVAALEDEVARLVGEGAAREAPGPGPVRPWMPQAAPSVAPRDYFESAPPEPVSEPSPVLAPVPAPEPLFVQEPEPAPAGLPLESFKPRSSV